jgi:hypothetical protein
LKGCDAILVRAHRAVDADVRLDVEKREAVSRHEGYAAFAV